MKPVHITPANEADGVGGFHYFVMGFLERLSKVQRPPSEHEDTVI